MKITHTIPLLTKGGAERVAADLANYAVSSGHEVTIIAAYPVDAAQLSGTLHPSVKIVYVSDKMPHTRWSLYISVFPWIWRNRKWLAQQDILHCHLTYGVAFGTLAHFMFAVLRCKRPAIIETYHSVGMSIPASLQWAHARLAEHFDAFVLMAEDKYWGEFTKRRPSLLSAIIYNGISFQRLTDVDLIARERYRREVGIPDNCRYIVGAVGRLRPDRKPWLYLPIFAYIANALGSDVHFIIGGDGPEYDNMRSLINKYGLDKQVHMPGLILDSRLPLSIMDIYITLNVGPVTGIAALEAAYLKIPVLAIQLRNDYKARPKDWIWSEKNLSKVASETIKLLRDQAKRRVLSSQQAEYIRSHHTVESMAKAYEDLYKVALDRLRSSGKSMKRQAL